MSMNLPTWLKATGIVVIALLTVSVVANSHRLDVYGTYIRQKSPEIATRLIDLSVEMDEAAVRKHFEGAQLSCVAEGPGAGSLGDRVCYTPLDKADGDAALMLAAFFRQGKLSSAIVHVPWWVHKTWMHRLTEQFGPPRPAGRVSRFGGPILRWSMSNGYVEFNRDRGIDVLEWNSLVWTGKRQGN